MASLNRVQILGYLGKDPDLRHTKGGEPVTSLSVATSSKFKDRQGEEKAETEWHRVTVWGKSAESCDKYLKKGSMVLVEGRLQTRPWKDDDGIERHSTDIVAAFVHFLDRKPGNRAPHPSGDRPDAAQPDASDMEIPL